jgi:hypothetical protein
MERRYLVIASAILSTGVLISASLLVTAGGSTVTKTTTISDTSVSTITSTERCAALGIYPNLPVLPPVWALVTATGLFNATVTGYSGSSQVFSQCYVGFSTGEIIPWTATNPQNWTSVRITAQKMGADNSNLTLNSLGGATNRTIAPFGFVSISTVPYNSSSG